MEGQGVDHPTQPDARQCAMLVAHLLRAKGKEVTKPVTRARLSEVTIRRLFRRQRLPPQFLNEVQEWLFRAGWVLFSAGTTYAVVKAEVVDGWGRISSKRIRNDLEMVGRGRFDFDPLEDLLLGSDIFGDEQE
jgi:hypothetical protein